MSAIKKEVIIGDCRLLLGNSLEIMQELSVFDSIVTDPPFGMSFRSNHRKQKHKHIENDGDVSLLQWACDLPFKHSAYIFSRWDNLREMKEQKSVITWVKNNWSMGDLEHEHGRQTEVISFYNGTEHNWPKKRPSDVVYGTRTGNKHHPTQKPVGLMCNIVGWTSGHVVDCFSGSFSTGVACAKLSRKFTGIELDEEYFNIGCKRIEEAYNQPDLFIEPPKPAPKQESMI